MRKVSFREALKRDYWYCKYLPLAFGIVLITLAFVLPKIEFGVFCGLGGLMLVLPFIRAWRISAEIVECSECKKLINKWDEYCCYCGKKNDLVH